MSLIESVGDSTVVMLSLQEAIVQIFEDPIDGMKVM